MLVQADWWLRNKAQLALNWGGKRFGWSKKGVLINFIVLNALSWLFIVLYHFTAWELIALIMGGFIRVVIFGSFVVLCGHPLGAETSWTIGDVFRKINMIFLPLEVSLGALTILSHQFSYLLLVGWLEIFSYDSIWYIAACREPPPKERKEAKKLAHVFG